MKKKNKKTTDVEAGRIAAQRPAPHVAKESPKEVAELDKSSPEQETPKEEAQIQRSSSSDSSSTSSSSSDVPGETNNADEPDEADETEQETNREEAPHQSSDDSSNTTDRARKAIDKADLPTLNSMKDEAEKRVDVLESELTAAKNHLRYIIKRRKIVKARENRDVEMERID